MTSQSYRLLCFDYARHVEGVIADQVHGELMLSPILSTCGYPNSFATTCESMISMVFYVIGICLTFRMYDRM